MNPSPQAYVTSKGSSRRKRSLKGPSYWQTPELEKDWGKSFKE